MYVANYLKKPTYYGFKYFIIYSIQQSTFSAFQHYDHVNNEVLHGCFYRDRWSNGGYFCKQVSQELRVVLESLHSNHNTQSSCENASVSRSRTSRAAFIYQKFWLLSLELLGQKPANSLRLKKILLQLRCYLSYDRIHLYSSIQMAMVTIAHMQHQYLHVIGQIVQKLNLWCGM